MCCGGAVQRLLHYIIIHTCSLFDIKNGFFLCMGIKKDAYFINTLKLRNTH